MRALLVLVLLPLLSACSGSPTPKKAEQARERALSAATTAGMIAAAWDSGAAPGIYSSHALRAIAAKLGRSRAAATWSALPAGDRRAIVAELGILESVTADMDTAVTRRDHRAAGALRQSLSGHLRALSTVPIDTAAP